jgi:hypothetical protein
MRTGRGTVPGMIVPPATAEQVQEMTGVLHDFLFRAGGFDSLLNPRLQGLVRDTRIGVEATPTPAELSAVSAGPGDQLLGLFTSPHPTIRVFANSCLALGEDPTNVLEHELGHRFGFDHDLRTARIPVLSSEMGPLCLGPHDAAGNPLGAGALEVLDDPPGGAQYCPVCHAHSDAADAVMLLEGLSENAWLAAQPHELPLGLGGTIPLMRRRLACAQLDLVRAQGAGMFPDRAGEVRSAARLLHQAAFHLHGILDPEAVTTAQPSMKEAWRAVYTLTWAYFLRHNHGDDPNLRVSDLQLIAAFQPAPAAH